MEMDKDYERKCYELAYLIFPDVDETVDDLEIKYPPRNELKEGAKVVRIGPSPTLVHYFKQWLIENLLLKVRGFSMLE